MFHVEYMKREDFSFAVKLTNTMDWNMTLEDFEFNLRLEPKGCLVLFDGSDRAGLATGISFGEVGWFGNLVVSKKYRNRHGGTLLVQKAVDYLKEAGAETIGLYAYQHLVNFYQRIGFEPNVEFLVLKGKIAVPGIQDKAMALNRKEVNKLVDFDRQCNHGDRRKLLDEILLDKSNRCYVSIRDSKIAGYVVAKIYDETSEIGPLVCRQDGAEAITLLRTVLSDLKGREVWVCLPTSEKTLIQLLFRAGLEESFRVTRMFLGTPIAENCTYVAESLERG